MIDRSRRGVAERLRRTPWHLVLLALWGARWFQAMTDHGGMSWHFFAEAGQLLVGQHAAGHTAAGGLQVYANYPRLQFGPVTYVVAAVMRLLGPHNGVVASQILMASTGLVLLALLERLALRARPDVGRERLRWTTLGAGLAVLPVWMVLAVQFSHLDDVLALALAVLALWALVAGRPILLGVLVAASGSAKPWAFAFLPLVLAAGRGHRRRAISAAVLSAAACWLPFLLAAPGSVVAAEYAIPNVATSGLRALGISDPSTPAWDRPAQIIVGALVAAASVLRRRWPAVIILGCAVRIALDPNTYLYYSAGVLLGAAAWDLLGAYVVAPLWSMISMAMLIAETGMSRQPWVGGDVRVCFVLIAAVPLLFGPAGVPRTGFDLAGAESTCVAPPLWRRAWHLTPRWRPPRRWALVGVSLALVASVVLPLLPSTPHRSHVVPLLSAGIASAPAGSRVYSLPPDQTGTYIANSSVLKTTYGIYGATSKVLGTDAAEDAEASWLAHGQIPGATVEQRAMAERALLDLRLSVRSNGAVVAAWRAQWRYTWPRDASWVAVALTATGHSDTAEAILRFLANVQDPDGTWQARYLTTADNWSQVADNSRRPQLDEVGWVPWAVWFWYVAQPATGSGHANATQLLNRLWPTVEGAANAAERSLSRDGLPHAASDYWELGKPEVTIENAAALRTGLRSAAALATVVHDGADARRWLTASAVLDRAIGGRFGPTGYRRTPSRHSGDDAAVTLLGPPFAPANRAVDSAVRRSARQLSLPNGGVLPGTAYPGNRTAAWTPETAFFALYDASTGNRAGANRWLGWLEAHRTRLGALPEQVTRTGQPASVAPLAWTDAITLLALAAQQHPLPVPPSG